ncbi:DUF1080 domain-containing protein [Rapidithrix thailandica]|uniref:DUF1080 domain-containing protein n=1 Tax=Rapidithrix thailandica TaxID=413964 RepID=A0AAW9S4T4_9BACT
MKKVHSIAFVSLLGLCMACGNTTQQAEDSDSITKETTDTETSESKTISHNQLLEEEKAEGWKLLFDGQTTQGWHSYLQEGVVGWEVKEGVISTEGGSGDLATDEEFENFELSIEWAISPQGNSGIFYMVQESEENKTPYMTGPEYQLIDDEGYPTVLEEAQKSGANYALHAPESIVSKAPGEFNHTRIIVNNGHVQHWLNGQKVVEYELGSEDWTQRKEASKFKEMTGYATATKGRIALQDHGDKVEFRNIKIKTL